jgi:hypothetical protein
LKQLTVWRILPTKWCPNLENQKREAVENREEGEIEAPQTQPPVLGWWARLIKYLNHKIHEDSANNVQESANEKAARVTASATKWIAFFTFFLAAAATYQFIILDRQLDTMRKDQRPWLKLDFTLNDLTVGQPATATMHIVNNGKTPARVVWGDMAIERVKNGESARLNYPLPHSRFTTGLIFPGVPVDAPITMLRNSETGIPEGDILMHSELDDFQHFRIFFVAYATVHYKDFFGVDHWTKLCAVEAPANVPGTFTGKNCTDYGDIDAN